MFRKSPVQAKGGQRELHRSLHGQRATGFDFVELQSIPAPFAIKPRNYGSKDRAVDVSGSKVYPPPPPAVGMVCSSLPVQRATINGLKGAPICLTGNPSSLRWMIVCSCLITGGPTQEGVVTATWCLLCSSRKGVKRARRESTLMSVIIVKEETESHLLGWSTQAMPKEHSFLFSCFIMYPLDWNSLFCAWPNPLALYLPGEGSRDQQLKLARQV